jgi:hypothetical protein
MHFRNAPVEVEVIDVLGNEWNRSKLRATPEAVKFDGEIQRPPRFLIQVKKFRKHDRGQENDCGTSHALVESGFGPAAEAW